jgi:adenylate cyclase
VLRALRNFRDLAPELQPWSLKFADGWLERRFPGRVLRHQPPIHPPEIVAVLDDVFTRFDAIAERCGLEKIKTIGDAYMAVAGVPEPREDDVEVAAQAALAMRDAIAEIRWPSGDPMRVRIGMATGPAVAGVIGQRKFA